MLNGNNDMPRERLRNYGAEALSDYELIAILLRTGVAGVDVISLSRTLIKEYGSLTGLLNASWEDLSKIKGMGSVKAVTLKAALEIGQRVFKELSKSRKLPLKEPSSVYYLCNDMIFMAKEVVRVISLNTRLNYSGMNTVTVGTLDSSLLHPREVFRPAINRSAAAIILVHNHPSGDPNPSNEDRDMTDRIREAGSTVGIKLLDHVIIGKGSYYSFTASKKFEVGDVE